MNDFSFSPWTADIYAFNAAGHVIRDRRELEKERKKTVNPKLKDYDEDYTPPEYDGSIIQDIPIQNILESSFLTPADRNRTRRSSTSFGSDGDGPRGKTGEDRCVNARWVRETESNERDKEKTERRSVCEKKDSSPCHDVLWFAR